MGEEINYSGNQISETTIKLRDLEEKQRILKDRVLLIGQNLIDTKEKINESILEIKKEIEELKENSRRMKLFIENISREFSKFARKDDLEILSKQMKMFQPLKYLKENK